MNATQTYIDNTAQEIDAIHNSARFNAESINQSAKDILREQCHNTASVIASNERQSMAIQDAADKNAISIRDAVERMGNENLAATERNGTAAVLATERTAAASGVAIERNGADTRDLVNHTSYETRNLLNHHHNSSMAEHKNTQVELTRVQGDLEKQAAENKAELQLDIQKSQTAIQSQAADLFAKLQKQACENFAALQLDAAKNKAELSAQLAECCCELKQKIDDSAAATQLLIRDLDAARIRDSLAAANTENLILRMQSGQTARRS